MYYYNQNGNNYIQVQLNDSFKIGKKYYGEYYVSLANTYIKSCNNIAMLFTKNPTYVDTNSATYPYLLQANPQILSYGNPIVTDTMGWVKISGIFTAQGGEQYLTLGNFKLAAQTQFTQIAPFGTGYNGAAYYIDDVAVYNLDSFCLKADAGKDTTIKAGDSVFIGSYTNGIDTIKWYNTNGQLIDSVQPGFWVKPTTTGTSFYVLQQTVNGCYSADTVYINAVLPLNFINYNIISNGVRNLEKSVENIWATAYEINVSHFNIQRSTNGKNFITIGKVKANNKSYNEYTFTDELKTQDQEPKTLYYRIVALDNDGKMNYSEVKKLSTINYKPSTINIYPNPANDVVHIESKEAIQQLLIIDYLGRTVKQLKVNSEQLIVDINDLPKGIYLLHITNKLNNVYNEKLIIQ